MISFNITVTNNTVLDADEDGIFTASVSHALIANNRVINYHNNLQIFDSNHIQVVGNVVTGANGQEDNIGSFNPSSSVMTGNVATNCNEQSVCICSRG